ncbi:hypothetical protein [Streptomyces sp. NRRL F-2664]|uniref:hypothetical protein n=1 Tax=Streptomyces sp. NRRL F-2664 TaxID=1463842 RepID=UPI000689DC13|nr:hypothetical protein [Streptomyces sp. NRRL F-2664]
MSTTAQAETALDAGAAFLVSPYPAPEVRAVARRRGAVFIEGGYTPAEIASAVRSAGAAKIFPAHVGGPRFVRSLRAVLPDAVLIPTWLASRRRGGKPLRCVGADDLGERTLALVAVTAAVPTAGVDRHGGGALCRGL